MIKKYTVVEKPDDLSALVSQQIQDKLNQFLVRDDDNPDLVLSVGGDGTMLHAFREYIDHLDHCVFLGIHTGTLGFFTDYQKDEMNEMVEDIRRNQYEITNRSLIDVHVYGKECAHYLALNEVRIENSYVTQVLNVLIDGEYLETFRGTGMCVSTPSGSTAYNRSLKGAIVSPSLEALQLTEIAGIGHNAYRSLESSLLLDKSQTIKFQLLSSKGAVLGVDQMIFNLDEVSCIQVTMSTKYMRCIQYRPLSFVSRIRRTFISE